MNERTDRHTLTPLLKTLFVGLAAAFSLLMVVYMLPTEPMQQNASESIELYEYEEARPEWAHGIVSSRLDNWTDAIMIEEAIWNNPEDSLVDKVMLNPFFGVGYQDTPVKALIAYLNRTDENLVNKTTYPSYWHGYLLALKPLLLLFNIQEIRMINMMAQLLLACIVMVLMEKQLGWKWLIPFGVSYIILNPVSLIMSFQYSDIYYITVISLIILLRRKEKPSITWLCCYFMAIGMATCYFDFLTYPVVSMGIPLGMYILLYHDSAKETVKKMVLFSILWCVGYAGFFALKWALAFLLTGENVLADGAGEVAMRFSGTIGSGRVATTPWNAVKYNLANVATKPNYVLVIVFAAFCLVRLLVKHDRFQVNKDVVIPLLFLSFYAFIWYVAIRNHSIIHASMTYRDLAVTAFALPAIIISCLETEER
ncbi:MAG: hypothetical protein VZT48_07875 [Bulleidia sp.]|nr:hypothetical protein [Bulleidia sp.]